MTTDLGACELFVYELRRSNLVDRGQLDQVVGDFLKRNPRTEPIALAENLVTQNVLSQFQAERVLNNKAQGLVLGPYNLVDSIGTGSMGTVYKAVNKTDNGTFAVKVLPRRSMWNVRLARRQVRSFTQFTHPSVVPFTDVGTSGGMHYLAWPLVEGETLEHIIDRVGKLVPEVAALYGLQIAHGLSVCHQNGLFHGLLKPSNVMIGSDHQARILDFGIGSLLVENDQGESLVDTMSTANTLTSGLDYSSPESIMEPTNRTPAGDQYSLGCILYNCLTGQVPFPDGSAVEKMMSHQFKQPTPILDLNPNVPEGLVAIIDMLMQKTPEARYHTAEDIVDALSPFAAEVSQVARLVPKASAVPVQQAPVSLRQSFKGASGGGQPTGPLSNPSNPLMQPITFGTPSAPTQAAAPQRTAPQPPPQPAVQQPRYQQPEPQPVTPVAPVNAIPTRKSIQSESNAGYVMPPGYMDEGGSQRPAPAAPESTAMSVVTLVFIGLAVMGVVYFALIYSKR